MMPHLSPDQLTAYLLDQPDSEAARHVRDCAACRAEIEQQRETLAEFRTAVRAWSADQAADYRTNAARAVPASRPEPRPWPISRQLAWALAIAAICVIASWILPRYTGRSAAANDAALLDRVDAEVSETVPAPMAPLMKLVVEQQ
jgi:anti-sigma factor RsiW